MLLFISAAIGQLAFVVLAALVFLSLGFFISQIMRKKGVEVPMDDKFLKGLRYSLTYGILFTLIGGLTVWGYFKGSRSGFEEYSPVQTELYGKMKNLNDEIELLKDDNGKYTLLISAYDSLESDINKQQANVKLIPLDTIINEQTISKKQNELRAKYFDAFYGVFDKYGVARLYNYGGTYEYEGGLNKKETVTAKLKSELYEALERQMRQFYLPMDSTNPKANAEILNTYIKGNTFASIKRALSGTVSYKKGELIFNKNNSQSIIQKKEEYLGKLNTEIKEMKQRHIDKMLITYALPIFGGIVILLLLIPAVYKMIKVGNDTIETDSIVKLIFEKGVLLQMFTVFILTVTILILGIGQKISSEVMGTLLGGISVYVLQNSFKNGGSGSGKVE